MVIGLRATTRREFPSKRQNELHFLAKRTTVRIDQSFPGVSISSSANNASLSLGFLPVLGCISSPAHWRHFFGFLTYGMWGLIHGWALVAAAFSVDLVARSSSASRFLLFKEISSAHYLSLAWVRIILEENNPFRTLMYKMEPFDRRMSGENWTRYSP